MSYFLKRVLNQLKEEQYKLEQLTYILPSRRAAVFLKKFLSEHLNKPIFSPKIYSIEEFVSEIAELEYATSTQLIFELYTAYNKLNLKQKDDFNTFLKWGQILLQDFNEINRYLIDEQSLFSYLSSIQKLKQWGVTNEKTDLITNYLEFWKILPEIFDNYNSKLLAQKRGYQGLVYFEASKNIDHYLASNQEKSFVFAGFNALNKAESYIIQTILSKANAQIYFDIDNYFLQDKIHSASHFIRNYKNSWGYFKTHSLKGISNNFTISKKIEIIGVPKSISQAKYVGTLLNDLSIEKPELLKNTALVLADENLLNPVLNAIPDSIQQLNITMGLSLRNSPLANLFESLIDLHINTNDNGFFFKDLQKLLANPFTPMLSKEGGTDYFRLLKQKIIKNNLVYINEIDISLIFPNDNQFYLSIFKKTTDSGLFIKLFKEIISVLKEALSLKKDFYQLEELYHVYKITNQIEESFKSYKFKIDLKTLKSIFFDLLSSETIDFTGNPTQGLQVMGMLETRVLDFETVILTSVNEGILPSGKSNNSFIPFDVKREFGLPTYKEKDAIYTYHFYRLLQSAKNIYLLYNTEPDVLEGGEKSRFINQLLTDENINKNIKHTIAAPSIRSSIEKENTIEKSSLLIEDLKLIAAKGFSPSSLTNYIRNPIEFYRKSVLKINIADEVEENIALNTFGTIIHDSLEDLYRPFIGQLLTGDALQKAKSKIPTTVEQNFIKNNSGANLTTGKNLITYNVIIKYINDFINKEIAVIETHQIKLLGVEENLEIEIKIPGLDFPVILKGKIDRIDAYDGQIRIIDYKTGKVEQSELELIDWDSLIDDKKYNKSFQLLCYALMYSIRKENTSFEAGIIAIKKINSGVFKFATKDAPRGPKNYIIDTKVLNQFTEQLKKLILEIFNPAIPFIEKEV